MPLEIELKFPVASFASVETALAERGARIGPSKHQRDSYWGHPQRDFGQTDEALRLRQVQDVCEVTYKGPRLDPQSKTRREIEFSVSIDQLDAVEQLLMALDFRPVAIVEKQRRCAVTAGRDTSVTVALDEVHNLGLFVELEVITAGDDFELVRDELLGLAGELGLEKAEMRSYLQLLMPGRDLDGTSRGA